ncbi:MAG TPA: hypothetical protein VF719_12645, partial [Abditibacteriaceae bacterium]
MKCSLLLPAALAFSLTLVGSPVEAQDGTTAQPREQIPVVAPDQALQAIGGGTLISVKAEAATSHAVMEDVFKQAGIVLDEHAQRRLASERA